MTAGHMRDPDFGILYAGIKSRDQNWNQNLGPGMAPIA